MRYLILGMSALALAAPAYAQSSQSFPREMDEEIVRSLPHPAEVEGAADTIGRAAEAILDVPIGGVVKAIDPTRRVHRDDTIADVAGERDPYVRERIRDSVDDLAVGMGAVVGQMAVIAPELRRSLAGIEESLDRAINDTRRRDYDRGYDRRRDRDDDRYDPDHDYPR
jgi:hypothetical protein